jgi:hypothetical protein
MRFVTDRCLQDGTPRNAGGITIQGTDFWFCSNDCYEQALDKYIPSQYSLIKSNPDNSPTFKAYVNEIAEKCDNEEISYEEFEMSFGHAVTNYRNRQKGATLAATQKLHDRLLAEAKVLRDEQAEKERKEKEKLDEKQRLLDEKEAIKQEERRQKEEAKRAEEDRWRPRMFKC